MSMTEADADPKKQTPLYKLRHSLAHIMAQAVLEVRPTAKLAFGPPVDNGFYYDFDFNGENLGEADFQNIEQRMKAIIKQRRGGGASRPGFLKGTGPTEAPATLTRMPNCWRAPSRASSHWPSSRGR